MTSAQTYCEQLDLPAATRNHLLLQLCALQLAQEQGVDGTRLPDVLLRARLARSTFYDCFDSLEGLWSALAMELNAEVFATVSPLANASRDPLTRIAMCLRLHLHLAAQYPVWGQFLGQVTGRLEVQNPWLEMFLLKDLTQAFHNQPMDARSLDAAHALSFAAICNGIASMHLEPATPLYAEHLVMRVLESLGVDPVKAKNLAFRRMAKPVTVDGMIFSFLTKRRVRGLKADAQTKASGPDGAGAPGTPDAMANLWNRRSVSPKRLQGPGPSPQELEVILAAAMHAPDHGRLLPWRVVEFQPEQREQLAALFEEEKLRRDPLASESDRLRAREHATRAPVLLAFVVSPKAQTTVPVSEQWLSAGAALGNLLAAAHSLGFGAMVLSGDRCADAILRSRLGLASEEHLAGFVSMGSVREAPPARPERPTDLVLSIWQSAKESSRTP